jgi:hypothetical protein
MRKTAAPTGSGIQPPTAEAQAAVEVPGMLSVRITDAPGEILVESLAQRISRRLLDEGEPQ